MRLKSIQPHNQDFLKVESIDIDNVLAGLSMHMRNKLYYTPEPFRTFNEVVISENYSTKNLRETVFSACTFEGVNLSDAGLAGSIFDNVTFRSGDYGNTNFRSSDFRNSAFYDCHLQNTGFDKSVFWYTHFEKCNFDNVSMCDCKFINCSFSECTWTVRIENTIFKDSTIRKTRFRNMNFEFVTFENIHLEEVKLPFPTIPFIYGGLSYLIDTQDRVRITSQTDKTGISKSKYLECIHQLEEYYIYTKNYFPLSNILIAKQRFKEALVCIFKGMEMSVMIRRFRMLPNYCKLIPYLPDADVHTRQQLYIDLLECINNANLRDFEQDNLSLYLPQVSAMLLEDTMRNSVTVFLDTNIDGEQTYKIAALYQLIDNLFVNICEYSIQLKHNSPINALVQFFVDPTNAELVINIIQTVLLGIQTAAVVYGAKQQKKKDDKEKYERVNIEANANQSEDDLITKRKAQAETVIRENNFIFYNCSITYNGEVHIYKN